MGMSGVCRLLPPCEQLRVGISGKCAAAKKQLKFPGAIKCIAQEAANGAAARPSAEAFAKVRGRFACGR